MSDAKMTTRGCACYRSLDSEVEPFPGLCFFETDWEEKFYDAPAPSEDIWKKFELLPTPPVSPKHETTYPTVGKCQLDLDDAISQTDFSLESLIGLSEDCHICGSIDTSDHNLKSNLIQDCMWSGQNLFAKDLTRNATPVTESSSQITINTSTSALDINASTDCVDPASVFPYPINEPREPDSLGAETPSDSEDEEIDVVTVNDMVQIQRRKPILPAAPTMSAQVAAMHNYNAPASSAPREPRTTPTKSPRCHKTSSGVLKRHRQDKIDRDNGENRPPLKKLRLHMATKDQLRHVVRKLHHRTHSSRAGGSGGGGSTCSSSRSSSDSEDGECRRSQHNILERKRRNDLKYSFQLLRQHVPDLGQMDKTPKVTILKKASDFIMGLRAKESHLRKQVESQRQKQEQLKRRLRVLRQSVAC